jgi:hypothetical protein
LVADAFHYVCLSWTPAGQVVGRNRTDTIKLNDLVGFIIALVAAIVSIFEEALAAMY